MANQQRARTGAKIRIISTDLEEPGHPMACQLLAFWRVHSSGGRLLRKNEIACRETRLLMPYLFLMQPLDPAGSDWVCRVIGSEILERFPITERKGETISQASDPDMTRFRCEAYQSVITTGLPRISTGRILGSERDFYEIEVVHLPVEANGARWLLGGMFFFS